MSLDYWANYADVLAVPIAIVGVMLIVRQLRLTRLESEKAHQRSQNEMTLNAYNAVRGDLRDAIRKVRSKLELDDMFDQFAEGCLEKILDDKELRNDVAKMLGFFNKFAVGIKYDVFNIELINDLSGNLFIETYTQFKPYIDWVRKDAETFYMDYENLVKELKHLKNYQERF